MGMVGLPLGSGGGLLGWIFLSLGCHNGGGNLKMGAGASKLRVLDWVSEKGNNFELSK